VLDEVPGEVELLAGGTDVVVGLNKRTSQPAAVVDLKRLDALPRDIEESDGRLRIGALAVLTELIDDPRVRQHFPALVEASAVVGSVQIRNRATLAGNVCNASPAADTVPALLVYGARVNVLGAEGDRVVALEEFFTGPGETVLERGEVVTSIELPLPSQPVGAAFLRITRRRGFDLGTVSVACRVARGEPTRFGLGAVAARPVLVVDDAAEEPTIDHVLSATSPITDIRGSREYRLAMLETLCRRAFALAHERMDAAA